RVLLDHVRVTAHALLGPDDARPALAEVGRAIHPRVRVAVAVAIERRVRRPRLEPAGLAPIDPGAFGHAGDLAAQVLPSLAAGARQVDVGAVGADPDPRRVDQRLADVEDGRVHLGRRVIDGDAARLLLLLLLGIVRAQIGRDALPGVAAVARAKQELRAHVQ